MEKDMQGYRPKKRGQKAWRLLHKINGETPKQRRQPLKTEDALVTDSRKKAKEFNKHFASTNTLQYTRE